MTHPAEGTLSGHSQRPKLRFRLTTIAPRKHKGAVDAEPFGKGKLDPEHGERLEQPGLGQVASIDGIEPHIRDELHNGLLALAVWASHEHNGPSLWVIGVLHIAVACGVEGLEQQG